MTVVSDVAVLGAVHEYGDRALLLDFASTAEVLAWTTVLREADLIGVVDIIPASRTVLIKLGAPRYQPIVRQRLSKLRVAAAALVAPDAVDAPVDRVVDVHYDGDDLAEVARLSGLTPAEVIAAHTAAPMRVAFGGFGPGFAYLVGGDARLNVPPRSESRPTVPAGSVALAREFSGVYPHESRSAWQLIGRTDAPLWDTSRAAPALLAPGLVVQFRAVGQ
jgi:KipI family sensor histidine kinase inhibitor